MVAEEGYVDFRGYRTWYRSVGERGTPLLALHGGPGSTHHYFAPLERLAGERRVVVYDQIGCGSSDRPTDLEWSVEVFREEVAAVREQLGLDRLGEIRVPTLVIRGRYDMCTPRIAQTLVRGIAGAREVVLEHSSHTPVLEETERYLEVVGRFMREAEGNERPVADEEERLIEEARQSKEKTQELREESGPVREEQPNAPPDEEETLESPEGEPWAKTSSGDEEN